MWSSHNLGSVLITHQKPFCKNSEQTVEIYTDIRFNIVVVCDLPQGHSHSTPSSVLMTSAYAKEGTLFFINKNIKEEEKARCPWKQ